MYVTLSPPEINSMHSKHENTLELDTCFKKNLINVFPC